MARRTIRDHKAYTRWSSSVLQIWSSYLVTVEADKIYIIDVLYQFYPWVLSNNSFISKKSPWNSVEMCRMTLAVLWTNFTHGFTLITLLLQEKCPWDSVEMCRMTLALLWIKYTHGFILITLTSRKMTLKLSGDV